VVDPDLEGAPGLAGRDHRPTVVGDGKTDTLPKDMAEGSLELLPRSFMNEEVWGRRERLITGVLLEGLGNADG
jgi:hypothetical protein